MKPHLILVGLPGVGKSTTGALVAELFDVAFFDTDRVISQQTGRSVSDIFSHSGEAAFRALETKAVEVLLADDRSSVIAPGGGWAAWADNLESSRGKAMTLYLFTSVAVAVERALQSGPRPVLEPDPPRQMAGLLQARRGFYERADHIIDAGNDPPEMLARRISELARKSGGW